MPKPKTFPRIVICVGHMTDDEDSAEVFRDRKLSARSAEQHFERRLREEHFEACGDVGAEYHGLFVFEINEDFVVKLHERL